MAKTKEQKRQEAIDRNRRNFPSKREEWQSRQPSGESYKLYAQYYGKDEADARALEANRRFAKEMAAAHCDAHGNPTDLSWQRLSDQIVVIRFVESADAWQHVVINAREKMFVQAADEEAFFVEYANWYEWGCAQRRINNRLYQFDPKITRSEGMER